MNFSRKEIIYAAAWALLIALSTIIPYSIGASFAPPGQHFMGFIGNNLDQNSYTAWMKQAEEGRIFFSGKFTTEAQSGWFFHPFFLACGWFAKLAGLETAAAYHLIRVLLAFLLLLSAYFFSGKFLKGKGQRLFFLVFLSLSSGIGWLFPQGSLLLKENIYAITCADKWITESITFMCLTTKSLFLAATLLMLGVFFFSLKSFETGKVRHAVYAGVFAFFLWLVHPYDMVTVTAALFLYLLLSGIDRERLKLLLLSLFVSVPAALYELTFFSKDPVFSEWGKMNMTLSPNPYSYVIGYGFIGLFAAFYIFKKGRGLNKRLLFPAAWLLATVLLTYLPFKFQRRFILGAHIPLAIFACAAVYEYLIPFAAKFKFLKKRAAIVVVFIITFLCLPSNILFVADDLSSTARFPENYFLPEADYKALKWLDNNAAPDKSVISHFLTGVYIPGVAGNTVYAGHYDQTINWEEKRRNIRIFFSPKTGSAQRWKFLEVNRIEYVFCGSNEKLIGFNPEGFSPLLFEKVYESDGVFIYRVR